MQPFECQRSRTPEKHKRYILGSNLEQYTQKLLCTIKLEILVVRVYCRTTVFCEARVTECSIKHLLAILISANEYAWQMNTLHDMLHGWTRPKNYKLLQVVEKRM